MGDVCERSTPFIYFPIQRRRGTGRNMREKNPFRPPAPTPSPPKNPSPPSLPPYQRKRKKENCSTYFLRGIVWEIVCFSRALFFRDSTKSTMIGWKFAEGNAALFIFFWGIVETPIPRRAEFPLRSKYMANSDIRQQTSLSPSPKLSKFLVPKTKKNNSTGDEDTVGKFPPFHIFRRQRI